MTRDEISHSSRPSVRWFAKRSGLVLAVLVLADWLLFNSHPIGISLALFMAACIGLVIAANPVRAPVGLRLVAGGALLLALAALAETISGLSVLVAGITMLVCARLLVAGTLQDWPGQVVRALGQPVLGPFRLANDLMRLRRLSGRGRTAAGRLRLLTAWTMPVTLSLVFLVLFISANPILEQWLGPLALWHLLASVSLNRLIFWLAILCLVWPLAHMTVRRGPKAAVGDRGPAKVNGLEGLFGAPSVLRALILFNALFALQTGLDMAYLWGGAALPEGMTHAAYAHRGAYPLIVTALLAAAFVLVALRPGGPAVASRRIVALVLVFVAQNVMLVASSIDRTMLYIDAYGLTEWRLAALIWMALVGIGLILIVIQILAGRSSMWLLGANAVALAATLYLCCFINFAYVIARYNITHWLERGSMGAELDMEYLVSLGPQVLPAVLAVDIAVLGPRETERLRTLHTLTQRGDENWRGWSFRGWRLKRYLATHAGMFPAQAGEPSERAQ